MNGAFSLDGPTSASLSVRSFALFLTPRISQFDVMCSIFRVKAIVSLHAFKRSFVPYKPNVCPIESNELYITKTLPARNSTLNAGNKTLLCWYIRWFYCPTPRYRTFLWRVRGHQPRAWTWSNMFGCNISMECNRTQYDHAPYVRGKKVKGAKVSLSSMLLHLSFALIVEHLFTGCCVSLSNHYVLVSFWSRV